MASMKLFLLLVLCSFGWPGNGAANLTTEPKKPPSQSAPGRGTFELDIKPLSANADHYKIYLKSKCHLAVYNTTVSLKGCPSFRENLATSQSPVCSLTHFRSPYLTVWVSISHRKPAYVKFGYGYRMAKNVLSHFVSEDSTPRHPLLSQITKLSLKKTAELERPIRAYTDPVTMDPFPVLIPTGSGTSDHDTDYTDGYFMAISKIPEIAERFETVEKWGLSQELIDAINFSLDQPNGSLSKVIKKKEDSGSIGGYIRVEARAQQLENSPGGDLILEIWPKGRGSTIHNHGESTAVIKVLHGSLTSEWYNPLVNGSHEEPQLIKTERFYKGNYTWMTDSIYQTHRLLNPDLSTAALTIQAYTYPAHADEYHLFFYYVNLGEPDVHAFFPLSDFSSYKAFRETILTEFRDFQDQAEEENPRIFIRKNNRPKNRTALERGCAGVVHKVGPEESPTEIARQYKTTPEIISIENGLANLNSLHTGQWLCMPSTDVV